MILFIAPNPHKAKKHEGFLQRVLAIDQLFGEDEKHYSSDYDDESLARLIIEADLVYVHSVYNAEKIIGCYSMFAHKIITDLHGIVPEEEMYADNQEQFRVMDSVESRVFSSGRYFVAVTNAMRRHFEQKYPKSNKATWIILPIHGEYGGEIDYSKKDYQKVIYAGGGQPWQNVGMMVDVVNRLEELRFVILTHDKDAFKGIGSGLGDGRVAIRSVGAKQVGRYYESASMGFILRDDNPVNNVACPTKLIEYLASGVVPIVLSEDIGDFKEMGYRFVTIKDLYGAQVRKDDLIAAIQENRSVYEKLLGNTAAAKKRLIKIASSIKTKSKSTQTTKSLILATFKTQKLENELIRQSYQIEVYKRMIGEYADLVSLLQSNKATKGVRNGIVSRIRTAQAMLRLKK